MSLVRREIALSIYRWATGRSRARLLRSFAQLKTFPAGVLFYHRISEKTPQGCSILLRDFERQIDWIQRHACPASLDAIYQSQISGVRESRMVGITFDDGYFENCQHAIPLLIARNIPTTYFVSTHYIQTGESFPHDTSLGQSHKPNTIEQIRQMADDGIQIGAHSHTHIDFGKPLSESQLKIEITDVRKRLQDWTGQSIDYFAFPYGRKQNISQEAVDTVFESGYKCFLSASGGLNWPGQDAHHLQRIHGDPGIAALTNWLTFDPRKIYKKSPIQYEFRSSNERANHAFVSC